MGSTRVTLAAGVALVLGTVRGFVPVSCGSTRCHFPTRLQNHSIKQAAGCSSQVVGFFHHPSPSSTSSSFTRYGMSRHISSRAITLVRKHSADSCFAVYGGSLRCTRASRASSATMGLAGILMPGGGRKLAWAAAVNAAAFATVGGGVLAGGLHAVSGPDHLAALLPRIMGQKWHNSMRIGATWGLGHGMSAMIIGLAAFFFKDRLGLGQNERLVRIMGSWTEGLVGVSLIAIGLLGLKESVLEYEGPEDVSFHSNASSGDAAVPRSVGAAGCGVARERGGGKAVFLNGLLHGFSWDGAPSLAPALALSSWGSVLWFLLAYCSGTMVAMSATTTLVGEGSVRVGKALDNPDIPRKLSIVSSLVAITIGVIWLAKAVFL